MAQRHQRTAENPYAGSEGDREGAGLGYQGVEEAGEVKMNPEMQTDISGPQYAHVAP